MMSTHRNFMLVVVIGTSFVAWAGAVLAEDPPTQDSSFQEIPNTTVDAQSKQTPSPPHRWSIYVAAGYKTRVHTAEDFKAGMTAGGYVDGVSNSIPGFWAGNGQGASPSGLTSYGALHLALGYDVSDKLGFRLVVNNGSFAGASGRRYDSVVSAADYINADGALTSIGALIVYRLTPALRLGAGPSFHRFTVDYEGDIGDVHLAETQAHNLPGVVLEGLLTVPARSGIFLFMGYQRHYILGFEIGPFGYMPKTPASINHSMWTFGLGLRL